MTAQLYIKLNNKQKTIIKYLIWARDYVLDTLFPKFCVGCGIEGTWLCSSCQAKIIKVEMQVCPECNSLSEKGKYCLKCRHKETRPLRGIMVAAYYHEGPMREMVHNFKYNAITELKTPLSELLVRAYLHNFLSKNAKDNLILTFVPMHPKRLAHRGYNQAELLAREVSKKINLHCQNLLIKKKATTRQVELSGKKRRQNLKDMFKVDNIKEIVNKKIIIVDDITTTGATLLECAKVLKAAGAKEVWGLVVARG